MPAHLPRNIGCTEDGCGGVTFAKGMCRIHYMKQLRATRPQKSYYKPRLSPGRISKNRSVAENILERARRDSETGCLLWQGRLCPNGYGWYGARKKAHRVAYEEAFGPIPKGLCVCHRCDVRHCVEPSHLFLGTHADNARDRASKGRNGYSKLSKEQVTAIREDHRPRSVVAKAFGVDVSTIRRICNGRSWRHTE